MYWNRFDIVEAWYLALNHCHGGMRSAEYRRMSNMGQAPLYFRPSPVLGVDTLTENGLEIYDNACRQLLAK